MAELSKHVEEIIAKHNRTANVQVVFLDIEKYSKRRTLTQTQVVDAFTACLGNALTDVSRECIEYAQKNGVNFKNDIISLPTGDGAAVVFSFEGLHDIHLRFALAVLRSVNEHNQKQACEKFYENGWCNCHPNLYVRIGVSEGKGVLYKDINGGYNVAGSVINTAARVMDIADRNQIIFSEEAFRQIVDMVDDAHLSDRFKEYKDVEVKHGTKLSMYHYTGQGESFINSNPPDNLVMLARMLTVTDKMSAMFPGLSNRSSIDRELLVDTVEKLMETMSVMQEQFPFSARQIDTKPLDPPEN